MESEIYTTNRWCEYMFKYLSICQVEPAGDFRLVQKLHNKNSWICIASIYQMKIRLLSNWIVKRIIINLGRRRLASNSSCFYHLGNQNCAGVASDSALLMRKIYNLELWPWIHVRFKENAGQGESASKIAALTKCIIGWGTPIYIVEACLEYGNSNLVAHWQTVKVENLRLARPKLLKETLKMNDRYTNLDWDLSKQCKHTRSMPFEDEWAWSNSIRDTRSVQCVFWDFWVRFHRNLGVSIESDTP